MKKQLLPLSVVLIIATLILSSCSAATAILPKQSISSTPLVGDTSSQSSDDQPVENNDNASQLSESSSVPVVTSGVIAAYEGVLENIYSEVNPSVVNIRVVKQSEQVSIDLGQLPNNPFFNIPGLPGLPTNPNDSQPNTHQYSQALGSGFVWDEEGHIVTNNHVVDGADKVEVTFSDDTTVQAKVIGSDSNSDLAVLKVDSTNDQLKPVAMGDSKDVKVGELAVAIGNPYGLEGTMTVGIISGLDRSLSVEDGIQGNASYSIPDIIQTDAAINPGNSGGVLVNDQGQVIGVTAAIESNDGSNAGIGFVIPSAIVSKVVPSLIDTGSYDHPYLGISGMTLTADLATAMDLDANQHGALVEEVVSGGPSDEAGIKGSDRNVTIDGQEYLIGGDVIVGIDDQPVKSMDDVIAYLADSTEVGQTVALSVFRDGKEISIDVNLGSRPKQDTTESQNASSNRNPVWLGITGISVNADVAKAINQDEGLKGILIQEIAKDSPADKAGLIGGDTSITINGEKLKLGGDVIIAIEGHAVSSISELSQLLSQYEPGKQVTLTIIRDEKEIEIIVMLEQRQ